MRLGVLTTSTKIRVALSYFHSTTFVLSIFQFQFSKKTTFFYLNHYKLLSIFFSPFLFSLSLALLSVAKTFFFFKPQCVEYLLFSAVPMILRPKGFEFSSFPAGKSSFTLVSYPFCVSLLCFFCLFYMPCHIFTSSFRRSQLYIMLSLMLFFVFKSSIDEPRIYF